MTRTVVVTGAGRGLGVAVTKRMLADDFRVVAVSRSRTPEIERLLDTNDNLQFEEFDLADSDGIDGLCRKIIAESGPMDQNTIYGLVNNAAVGNDGVLGTMHKSEIEAILDINVKAPILLTKYLSRAMLATTCKGRIINIGSIIGSTGYSGLSVYGASKAALEGFSRSLSRELGRTGITVNVVAPGYMETDMTSSLQAGQLESIRRRSALRLFARPMDVANAVSYLMGPDGERVTGTVLTVDAGSTA